MQNRQTVGIVQGQGGNGTVGVVQLQVFGNRRRVRRDIALRQPHQTRVARRTGCRQHQAEVRVQVCRRRIGVLKFDPCRGCAQHRAWPVGPQDNAVRGQAAGFTDNHRMRAAQRAQIGRDGIRVRRHLDGDKGPHGLTGILNTRDPGAPVVCQPRKLRIGDAAARRIVKGDTVAENLKPRPEHPRHTHPSRTAK